MLIVILCIPLVSTASKSVYTPVSLFTLKTYKSDLTWIQVPCGGLTHLWVRMTWIWCQKDPYVGQHEADQVKNPIFNKFSCFSVRLTSKWVRQNLNLVNQDWRYFSIIPCLCRFILFCLFFGWV